MMVLRLTLGDRTLYEECAGEQVVLGGSADADVTLDGAGWAAREAVLAHEGTEVLCHKESSGDNLRLGVGDEIVLGRCRVALIGILPLPPAPDLTPPPLPPQFGGYDEELPGTVPGPFSLEGEEDGAAGAMPDEATRPASTSPTNERAPDTRLVAAPGSGRAGKPSGRRGLPPRRTLPLLRQQEFGTELLAQLKRAPFFLISLGLHVLVLLVLASLHVERAAGALDDGTGALQTGIEDLSAFDEPELSEFDETEAAPTLPEFPELAPEDLLPEPEIESDPDTPTLAPLPEEDVTTLEVGLGPSLHASRDRARPRSTPVTTKALQKTFGESGAADANGRAAEIVRTDLGLGGGRRGSPLESLKREDILVVSGGFDKIHRVLDTLRLPYTEMTPAALTLRTAPPLDRHMLVFWNCGERLPPRQIPIAARRIRAFVEGGGYLFTTDWVITTLLVHAFPGYLASTGAADPLPEMVIDVKPAPGRLNHPLLEGVFRRGATGKWWLEQASFDVKVKRHSDVTVLIESPDLQQLLGRSKTVAATFKYGHGRVLHVAGHYYQEAGNLAGAIAAQRLALNFVLARLRRR